MKVLRVGMTYPNNLEPGIGLHSYYHSYYSNNEELIITLKQKGVIWENRPDVKVVQLEVGNSRLGVYNDNLVKRIILLFRKIICQYRFLQKAKPYIKRFRPDIVHLYTPVPILCGLYARRKFDSKIVVSLHGSDALRISKDRFMSFLINIPDVVVSVSNDTETVLKDVRINKRIICIGNGVDLSVFKCSNRERYNQFVHVANLRWQKGQEYLLQAFSLFHAKHSDYSLVIIGNGEQEAKLRTICVELSLTDSVFFQGTRGREYIANQMNHSKAFVLSSVTEGLPKVIIEAMATGTPVISTDVGSIKSVLGGGGIIVEPKNITQLSEAMERIVEDPKAWEEYSEVCIKNAQEYSWEKNVARLQNVYEEIQDGR